ncbi:DUF3017 domain-containing protein [Serinicoccus kebangsaanensis]|uniref:DUF3017 domain-containing protein n=1 Tax=Serinicoccus kebangsaanensis TaxID=2602069 RepID=UPI00124E6DFF|nr:DUF3017 domain-containing protein [Serinicoccus kebangsaanensis]
MSPTGDADESQPLVSTGTRPLGPWWLAVLGLVAAGMLLMSSNLRAYGYALGGTLGLLAVLRAVLPAGRAGGLVVRGRWIDVLTLLVLGVAVAVLASTLRLV